MTVPLCQRFVNFDKDAPNLADLKSHHCYIFNGVVDTQNLRNNAILVINMQGAL